MTRDRPTPRPRPWPAVLAASALGFAVVVVFAGSPADSPGGSDTVVPDLAEPPASTTTLPAASDAVRFAGYPFKPAGWRQLDSGPLASRMNPAVVWAGDRLLVWGGEDLRNGFGSGAVYRRGHAAEPAWEVMPRPSTGGGAVRYAVWTDRTLMVHTDEPAVFDPIASVWGDTDRRPFEFEPFAAAWTGVELIVVGRATDGSGTVAALSYAPDGTCCRVLAPPPVDIDHAVATWNGTEVVVIGGRTEGNDRAVLTTYRPDTDTWETRGPTPLHGGPGLSAVWTGGTLLAVDANSNAGRWNEAAGWRSVTPPPFESPGCFARLAVVGDDVFAWHCRQAATYDPAGGRWTPVPTPELPSHAISTSCTPAADGRTVYLWCGNGDGATPLFFAVDLEAVGTPPIP